MNSPSVEPPSHSTLTSLPPGFLDGVKRLALIGVAKNSGKTTTLGTLLEEEAEPVGLLSVGIDGEPDDFLLGTSKPPVRVKCGDLVVTAQRAIESSTTQVEYLEGMGFEGPLGEVFVVRITQPGNIMLAGLRHRGDMMAAVQKLEERSVKRVYLDGAYGRLVAGHTDISDAVLVATGAVLGGSIEAVVSKTMKFLRRFLYPKIEAPWHKALMQQALAQNQCLLGGPSEHRTLPSPSALLGLGQITGTWSDKEEAIAIPGLVSDRILSHLIATPPLPHPRALLVTDATLIHASDRLLRRLESNWTIHLLQTQTILGISVNPTSPIGEVLNSRALQDALWAKVPDPIVVFDPWQI